MLMREGSHSSSFDFHKGFNDNFRAIKFEISSFYYFNEGNDGQRRAERNNSSHLVWYFDDEKTGR